MVYNINMNNKKISHDLPNTIVKDVLTQDQIDRIYKSLENPSNTFFFNVYGQTISDFALPDDVRDRVVELAEKTCGVSDLEIAEYQFSRYAATDPDNLPNLFPHFDKFDSPRLTFDYQIKSNTEWALSVEGKEFVLSDNQALTFSGTHQIHWRLHKTFGDDEHIDMVFFHLKQKVDEKSTQELTDLMQEKKDKYSEIWYNNINKGDTNA